MNKKEDITVESKLSRKTVKQWMKEAKKQPIPKMLFDLFWFEFEFCLLFADTNVGKSILAVQIADSISKGTPIERFLFEASQQRVLYFDLELSKKQWEKRYSRNYKNHYAFHKNFERVEKNIDVGNESLESYVLREIIESGAKIIIIDNLTILINNLETASSAKAFMVTLKQLKSKHELSILGIAHTPKRNISKPITENDMRGSKMLIDFCDSAFTIGASANDNNIKYLKQIKVRNTEKKYDTHNIMVCQVCKPKNFLHFEFLKFGREQEHLKLLKKQERESLINEIIELHLARLSYREIGTKLGISHMKVSRILHGGL